MVSNKEITGFQSLRVVFSHERQVETDVKCSDQGCCGAKCSESGAVAVRCDEQTTDYTTQSLPCELNSLQFIRLIVVTS